MLRLKLALYLVWFAYKVVPYKHLKNECMVSFYHISKAIEKLEKYK